MSNSNDKGYNEWDCFYKGVTEAEEFTNAANNDEVGKYLLDKTGEWITDNPELLFNAVFGEELVKNSRIDISVITEVKDFNKGVQDKLEAVSYTVEFTKSAGIITNAIRNDDQQAYYDELPNMGNHIITGAKYIVSDPINGALIDVYQYEFNKGVEITTNHVSQLKYTEIMCDYYSSNKDVAKIKKDMEDIVGLKEEDKNRILALLEMHEQLEKEGIQRQCQRRC